LITNRTKLLAMGSAAIALAAAAPLFAEAQDPRMVEIVDLIRSGKNLEAVSRADAMIAGFSRAQSQPGVAYFCNREGGGVKNLVAAIGSRQSADLAPEAWCEALFAKGVAFANLGMFTEASEALAKAVAMDPTNVHFLNEFGNAQLLGGDAKGALRTFSRAQTLAQDRPADSLPNVENSDDPRAKAESARALRGMGKASHELGDLQAAQDYFEHSLEIDADSAEARTQLAEIAKERAAKR